MEISVADTQGGQGLGMHLISSIDGSTWVRAGKIPPFDYRYSYILFPYNDNLYFVSLPGGLRYGERFNHKQIYRSADEGATWEKDVLWDTDEAANPDYILFVLASDSVIFASYLENGAVEKESFLFNGRWTTLPSGIIEKQQLAWLAGNTFFWVDPGYSVKSIKLF
jgi:hypothetical protein